MPGITKLVDLKLADSDCLKFAQTILDQLSGGKGGSLADVFNSFLDQPKPHDLFTRERPVGSRGEATALGNLKNSTAAMYLSAKPFDQTVADADNVIQELFHFAGKGYSDRQLAEALFKTPYAKEASGPFPDGTANIFDPRYIPGKWSKHDGYSTYFHAIAARHCGIRPPNVFRNLKK